MSPQINGNSGSHGSHLSSQTLTQNKILPHSVELETPTSADNPLATHLRLTSTIEDRATDGINGTSDDTPTKAVMNDSNSSENKEFLSNTSAPMSASQAQYYPFSPSRTIIAVTVAILIFGTIVGLFLCVGMRGRRKAGERQSCQQPQQSREIATTPTSRRGEGITQSNIPQPSRTYNPRSFDPILTSHGDFSESGPYSNPTIRNELSFWSQTTLGSVSGSTQNPYPSFELQAYPTPNQHSPQLQPQEGTRTGLPRTGLLLSRISFLHRFSTRSRIQVRSVTSPTQPDISPDRTPTPNFTPSNIRDSTQYLGQRSNLSFSDPLAITRESTNVVPAPVDYLENDNDIEPIIASPRASTDLDLDTPRNWEINLPDVDVKSKPQDPESDVRVEQLHTPPRSPSPNELYP